MKLKKLYTFKTNRQIWRLLLTDMNRLIIEDRDPNIKEVFFSCLDAGSGKKILSDLQFEEKFWIGIETVYKEIIYFHKFQKPDMPGHKIILAYGIDDKRTIWENDSYNFLFIKDDKVYTYRQLFDSRNFYTLDYLTGELIEDLGKDPVPINTLRENLYKADSFKNYYFPEALLTDSFDQVSSDFIKSYIDSDAAGTVEHIKYGDFLLMNYHIKRTMYFTNTFYILDLSSRKLVLKEVLNEVSKAVVPDSFFIKEDLLFVLKERQQLTVFRIV